MGPERVQIIEVSSFQGIGILISGDKKQFERERKGREKGSLRGRGGLREREGERGGREGRGMREGGVREGGEEREGRRVV